MRATGPGTIMEAFKPGTGPPDAYGGGGGSETSARSERSVGSGTGGLY
jgi:penicillin-binding protein 1A